MEIFNIKVEQVTIEDGLSEEDKAMTQMILNNLGGVEETADDFVASLEAFVEQEAQKVVDILDKYKKDFDFKLEYPIFIDIEWSDQVALGSTAIREIIDAAAKVIENHGYTF